MDIEACHTSRPRPDASRNKRGQDVRQARAGSDVAGIVAQGGRFVFRLVRAGDERTSRHWTKPNLSGGGKKMRTTGGPEPMSLNNPFKTTTPVNQSSSFGLHKCESDATAEARSRLLTEWQKHCAYPSCPTVHEKSAAVRMTKSVMVEMTGFAILPSSAPPAFQADPSAAPPSPELIHNYPRRFRPTPVAADAPMAAPLQAARRA